MRDIRYALMVATVVVGSFLSFVSEPMVGRMVVPFFGGAVHVWTVCMMTFQALLLAGYAYAHLVAPKIGLWHVALMALALPWLPLEISASVDPGAPILALVGSLLRHIAVPFFTVATTAVVVQYWFAQSELSERTDPYTLYAASNAGSLGALIGYPVLVEPFFGIASQRVLWNVVWLAWLLLLAASWWSLRGSMRPQVEANKDGLDRPTMGVVMGWLMLAAAPSALLLSVTQFIASEIGSFPMVWVVPLALYLGSFILAFRVRDQSWLMKYWPDLVIAMVLVGVVGSIALLVAVLVVFFSTCWLVHTKLFSLRPDPRWLTSFYLVVAAGGWLGGLLMSLGPPTLLDTMVDVELAALFTGATLLWTVGLPSRDEWLKVPVFFRLPRLCVMGLMGLSLVFFHVNQRDTGVVATHRNFYGTFLVRDVQDEGLFPFRSIRHGAATVHGLQYLEGPLSGAPLSYYHYGGPSQSLALRSRPANVGVVGLGAGSIAGFMQPGERIVFYEIDADNEGLARQWFTFLGNCKGEVDVRVGDARLLLAVEPDQQLYDAIFVDAFYGDAIPLHLLTVEALETYLSRLTEDGLLVLHLSNRYYDLRGVVSRLADELGLYAAWKIGSADPSVFDDLLIHPSTVMTLSRKREPIDQLIGDGWTLAGPGQPFESPLWTDDYQNVLRPLWHKMTLRLKLAVGVNSGE